MIPAFGLHDLPFLCSDRCAVNLTVAGGGDTYDCYDVEGPGITQTLARGSNWGGAWAVRNNYTQIQGVEDFEVYTVGSNVSSLNGPWGFSGAWVVGDAYTGITPSSSGMDDYESYATGDVSTMILNGGTGWDGVWVTNVMSPSRGADDFESYSVGAVPAPSTVYEGRFNFSSQIPNWTGVVSTLTASYSSHIFGNGFYDILANRGYSGQQLFLYVDTYGFSYSSALTLPAGNYTLDLKTAGNLMSAGALRIVVCETWTLPDLGYAPVGPLLDTTIVLTPTSALQTSTFHFTAPGGVTYVIAVYGASGAGCVDDIVLTQDGVGVFFTQDFNTGNPHVVNFPYGGYGWTGSWVVR